MSKELNPSTASATGNPRNKTALKPGYSLMGWIRLTNSGEDLTGFKGKIVSVSHQELAKHNSFGDCWMAVRGKVYNVTKYLEFHPGGADQLMRGAGKDATSLFDEFHAWVNIESLLAKCFIGPLKNTTTLNLSTDDFFMKKPCKVLMSGLSPIKTKNPLVNKSDDKNLSALNLESFKKKTSNESEENVPVIPRFDWIQKTTEVAIFFYTKAYCNPGILVRYISDKNVEVYIFIAHAVDCYNFTFLKSIRWPCSVKLNCESGKIEMTFTKETGEIWSNFGTYLKQPSDTTYDNFESFTIISRHFFNHDSFIMSIRPEKKVIIMLPVGSHVNFQHVSYSPMETQIMKRSYTPVPSKYASTSNNPVSSEDLVFLIKTYEHGAFSRHLSSTKDTLKLGMIPKGALNLSRLKSCTKFAMLAAGSGITPMLSVLHHLLDRRENRIESLTLFYFNKTENDIWLKEELESIGKNDDRLRIEHMFSEAEPPRKLDKEIVEKINKLVDFIFICGPTKFNDLAVSLLSDVTLDEYKDEQDYWVFQ